MCAILRFVGEALFPAPQNAVGVPPGASGKGYFGRRLVLARLVWKTHTEVVPGVVLWREQGRVCVEWEPRPGAPKRLTWLLAEDVRPRLRYGGREDDAT
jgi:hypothetical protein